MKKEIEKLIRHYRQDVTMIENQKKSCSNRADIRYRNGKINQLESVIDDLKNIISGAKL